MEINPDTNHKGHDLRMNYVKILCDDERNSLPGSPC